MTSFTINDQESVTIQLDSSNSVIKLESSPSIDAIISGTSLVGIDVFLDRVVSGSGTGTGFVSQAQWLVVDKIAGENIDSFKMIRFANIDTVVYARANGTREESRPFGITITSSLAGNKVKVLVMGIIENPIFTYPSGTLLFLSTNGSITDVVPTLPSSNYSLVVGEALAVGVISLSIRTPVRL